LLSHVMADVDDLFGSDSDSDSDGAAAGGDALGNLGSGSDSDSDASGGEGGAGLKLKLKTGGGKRKAAGGGKGKAKPAPKRPRQKKKKKTGVSAYIDAEAEDEDGEEDFEEEVVRNARTERELQEAREADQEYQRVQAARDRRGNAFMTQTAEETAANIAARHRESAAASASYGRGGGGGGYDSGDDGYGGGAGGGGGGMGGLNLGSDEVKQGNLPEVKDPQLWSIPCKTGMEQSLVLQLMNKSRAFQARGDAVHILSATATTTRSYMFVETRNESGMRNFLRGIQGIYSFKMKKVPINEMTGTSKRRDRKWECL